jgi:hypothetical protein
LEWNSCPESCARRESIGMSGKRCEERAPENRPAGNRHFPVLLAISALVVNP